jgi:hypothetical protein
MTDKYEEVQKADSIWALSILALTVVFNWYIYFVNHYDNLQFFYTSMLSVSLICSVLTILNLRTFIDNEGVHYRLFPFQWDYRIIRKQDIVRCKIITYNPLKEYGGWGLRYTSKGKAFTIKGNKGLMIYLSEKKKPILIGTCDPERLKTFLEHNRLFDRL